MVVVEGATLVVVVVVDTVDASVVPEVGSGGTALVDVSATVSVPHAVKAHRSNKIRKSLTMVTDATATAGYVRRCA